ncbi:MAG TPA: ECF transporter S component [Candidatus Scatomonas merdavium]|nr:ECF transporter S component [Candidatus Scatomonas merdavium]
MRNVRVRVLRLTVTAFCIALNIVGSYLALLLRLPIYLDSIGTILAGALMGPWYGLAAAVGNGLISGVLTDVYSLYFLPVGAVTGLMAGLLFRKGILKGWKVIPGSLALTVPGTVLSASISAFLFGGVTSSGSSLLVQLFHHLGLNLVASAFAVQIVTDYADRLISVLLVLVLTACLSVNLKMRLKGVSRNGKI